MTENLFRKTWDLGYHRLVPVAPPGANAAEKSQLHGRTDLGKIPGRMDFDTGLWWSYDWLHGPDADEADLDRFQKMGAGVGIKTGGGLHLIDADAPILEHAKIIKERLEARLGAAMPVRIGKNPKAGYLIRISDEYPYKRISFGPLGKDNKPAHRVEILGDKKYFVAYGQHPDTGKPYSWPRELVPFDDLPVFTGAEIDALLTELGGLLPAATPIVKEGAGNEVSQASLRGDVSTVRRAVEAIPNTHNSHPAREDYRDVLYAIKAALPNDQSEAFEIALKWCEGWTGPHGETNDPDLVRKDWDRMKPPYRRGATWLYEQAKVFNSGFVAHYEELPPASVPNPFEEAEKKEAEAAGPKILPLVTIQEAAATALTAATKPLVKGLLDQGTLSVMYGPSNVGKTFVCMDVFFHIAAGLPWGGMKVQQGRVVYVAAEGGAGARKRADALMRRYPGKVGLNDFYLHLASIDLLRPDADLGPLIDTIRGVGPVAAVALDTLSRVMAGGEENSSVDMGVMVKHFDRIRQATGAHVMIVHHSGKDQAKGARGHSLLRAATDTEIEIGDGQIAVTKQRDLDKAYATAFRLGVVELGQDGDGEPITSCTVDLAPRQATLLAPLTPTEQTVFDALTVLLSSSGDTAKGVRASEVAEFLDNMSAETVRAHLKNMAKKQAAMCPSRGFWAPKSGIPFGVNIVSQHFEAEESGRKSGRSVFE